MAAAPSTGPAGTTTSTSDGIADLVNYPQDCAAYIAPGREHALLIDAGWAKEMVERFRREFFAPWRARPREKALVLRDGLRFDRAGLFGPNLRPRPEGWAKGLLGAAGMETYPNRVGRAITLRNTDLRELPTPEPCFEDPAKAGEGYPFDVLQNTALWAGTPLLVAHVTPLQWAYVQSPLGNGWLPVRDVGLASDELAAEWERAELAAITADDVPVVDEQGNPLFVAHLGAVLPLAGASDTTPTRLQKAQPWHPTDTSSVEGLAVWAAARGGDGSAVKVAARVASDKACLLPMPMTPANLAAIGNVMIGQCYGWGGMYENRDCSSTLHDLFVPFGLWLPRNSGEQARAGAATFLQQLPPEQREGAILRDGAAWLTVVHAPGHVMLYIGQRNGRAMVLQNLWGVVTVREGREERHVVGRCAITTLQPGIERKDILLPRGDARTRIDSMTLLAKPAGGKP